MKKCQKIIAFILVSVTLTLLILPLSYAVSMDLPITNNTRLQRINKIFQSRINAIQENSYLKVSSIKQLIDFHNNQYTLAEYSPTGYAIMNEESGQFLEYSAESLSPFLGYDKNLYYGDPTQYYIKTNQGFYLNLFTNQVADLEKQAALTEYCDIQYQSLCKNSDQNVSTYLTKQVVNQEIEKAATLQNAGYTEDTKYVSYSTRLSNLANPGYIERGNGVCGYIAAAMLLYYYTSSGRRYITSKDDYYTQNGKYYINKKLTVYLVDNFRKTLNLDYSTTAQAIYKLVSNYITVFCRNRGLDASGISHSKIFAPFIIKSNIAGHIYENRPVILFGSLYSPTSSKYINHAVLAYGYYMYMSGSTIMYQFIVHFGYPNYSKVYLNERALGSYYVLSC